MRGILFELFFLLLSIFGLVCAGIALGLASSPLNAAAWIFLIALNLRNVARNLHALWEAIYTRRREAQLTWAIRWWCRHMPDEWFSPRHRAQTLGRVQRPALRVVN